MGTTRLLPLPAFMVRLASGRPAVCLWRRADSAQAPLGTLWFLQPSGKGFRVCIWAPANATLFLQIFMCFPKSEMELSPKSMSEELVENESSWLTRVPHRIFFTFQSLSSAWNFHICVKCMEESGRTMYLTDNNGYLWEREWDWGGWSK